MSQPFVVYRSEKGEVTTISRPMKLHDSGLCFFHLKRIEGWFDLKYPLFRNGQPKEQLKSGLREELKRVYGLQAFGGLFKLDKQQLKEQLKHKRRPGKSLRLSPLPEGVLQEQIVEGEYFYRTADGWYFLDSTGELTGPYTTNIQAKIAYLRYMQSQ
jgi:hypothetical protein